MLIVIVIVIQVCDCDLNVCSEKSLAHFHSCATCLQISPLRLELLLSVRESSGWNEEQETEEVAAKNWICCGVLTGQHGWTR